MGELLGVKFILVFIYLVILGFSVFNCEMGG